MQLYALVFFLIGSALAELKAEEKKETGDLWRDSMRSDELLQDEKELYHDGPVDERKTVSVFTPIDCRLFDELRV